MRNIILPSMLSTLDYKYFFTLIKRDKVSTINIKKIYTLKYRIVLFSPTDNIVYLINTVEKRKKIKFLLNYLGIYNHESFI